MQLSDCQSIRVDTKGGNNVIMQLKSSRHANYTNEIHSLRQHLSNLVFIRKLQISELLEPWVCVVKYTFFGPKQIMRIMHRTKYIH